MKDSGPYIHRDISWLSFNYRVLQEAMDENNPLFERIKFLAIYSSNLDEFFRVRVANHKSLVRAGKKTVKNVEFEPKHILEQILKIVNKQQEKFSEIFQEQIVPSLKENNIYILKRKKLNSEQQQFIENLFHDDLIADVQPVLLQGDKIKPFLSNGSLYLAIYMKNKNESDKSNYYAIVKIPSDTEKRFWILPSRKRNRKEIILLDDIIRHNIRYIFPGYEIIDSFSIKLTRDAELYIDDEYSGDLLEKIKKSLSKRDVGIASRLVYDREMPDHFIEYLMEVFELDKLDILPEGRYHNNSDFFKFPNFGMKALQDIPLPPMEYPDLEKSRDFFAAIRRKDHLLYFPYHSYESVIRFFEIAAEDPRVSHIKIFQYRVAKESRIMNALVRAVKNGKQVTSFIEVKARFDEEANLSWGERLSAHGINVLYSLPGLKVHSKMAAVRRMEDDQEQIYTYFSTGNFHEQTAKLYTDFGMFTVHPQIVEEAMRLFAYIETKITPDKNFELLGVGTFNLKRMLIDLVNKEVENAQAGKPAKIELKMNSLQDAEMIDLLYAASQKGVKIKMIVRGICSLVPQLDDISENIKAFSIVDRFLEHARVFIFHNDGDELIYISSADWMVRNLHHRIEAMVPILDPENKKMIKDIMRIQLSDNVKARYLDLKQTNEYKRNSKMPTRSQFDTYYYLKRQLEFTQSV